MSGTPEPIEAYEKVDTAVTIAETGNAIANGGSKLPPAILPPGVAEAFAPLNIFLGGVQAGGGAYDLVDGIARGDAGAALTGGEHVVSGGAGATAGIATLAGAGPLAAIAGSLSAGLAIGDMIAPTVMDPIIGALTGHRPGAQQVLDQGASARNEDRFGAAVAQITSQGGTWHLDGKQLIAEYPDGRTERVDIGREKDIHDA